MGEPRTDSFAADRPTGPRTMKGHALASRLRRTDPEVDWDAWVRGIEEEAARWVGAIPVPLDRKAMLKVVTATLKDERWDADRAANERLARIIVRDLRAALSTSPGSVSETDR